MMIRGFIVLLFILAGCMILIGVAQIWGGLR